MKELNHGMIGRKGQGYETNFILQCSLTWLAPHPKHHEAKRNSGEFLDKTIWVSCSETAAAESAADWLVL